jgi:hypothetical protein
MRRFTANRSWTLIPALWLSLVLVVVAATDLRAQTRDYYDDPGTGGGGSQPGTAAGDPDMPGSTLKGGPGQGRSATVRLQAVSRRTAGDSPRVSSDWKWRLQLVLREGLKLYIRF